MAKEGNKNKELMETAKKAGAVGIAAGVGAAIAGPIGIAGAAATAVVVRKLKKKKK